MEKLRPWPESEVSRVEAEMFRLTGGDVARRRQLLARMSWAWRSDCWGHDFFQSDDGIAYDSSEADWVIAELKELAVEGDIWWQRGDMAAEVVSEVLGAPWYFHWYLCACEDMGGKELLERVIRLAGSEYPSLADGATEFRRNYAIIRQEYEAVFEKEYVEWPETILTMKLIGLIQLQDDLAHIIERNGVTPNEDVVEIANNMKISTGWLVDAAFARGIFTERDGFIYSKGKKISGRLELDKYRRL